MKLYVYDCVYRGQQITKEVCAKNYKQAAYKLQINIYNVKKYTLKHNIDNPFEGVICYFNSGILWREAPSLINKRMYLEELKSIIDFYKDKK